jgi:hypothetical protein
VLEGNGVEMAGDEEVGVDEVEDIVWAPGWTPSAGQGWPGASSKGACFAACICFSIVVPFACDEGLAVTRTYD